jgi:hypothetical protein
MTSIERKLLETILGRRGRRCEQLTRRGRADPCEQVKTSGLLLCAGG